MSGIFDDWNAAKKAILEELEKNGICNNPTTDNKVLTEEEEADEIIRRLSTPPAPPIPRVIIPMIRRIIPNAIATEIINVQPMQESAGKIHQLKIKYHTEKDEE